MASFTIGYVTNQIRKPLDGIIHHLDKALAQVPPPTADKAANAGPGTDVAAQQRGVETGSGGLAEELKGCRQNCELLQTILEVWKGSRTHKPWSNLPTRLGFGGESIIPLSRRALNGGSLKIGGSGFNRILNSQPAGRSDHFLEFRSEVGRAPCRDQD